MLHRFRGPGPPKIKIYIFITFFCFVFYLFQYVSSEKNQNFTMHQLCNIHYGQNIYRKIDGAVLKSQNEHNLDCIITFQTHTVLQRLMLRFDMLQLDCNDHLFIYDGAHATGNYKADLSCRNTKSQLGAIITRTNFVTLKYVTDNWGTDSNGFSLVITAVKDQKTGCKDFSCKLRDFCIHTDLVCDKVNHCGDGTDELSATTTCSDNDEGTILGLSLPILVVVSISSLLILAACGVVASLVLCRNRPAQQQQNSTPLHAQYPVHQLYSGSNGTSQIHIQKASPVSGTTVISPVNWAHPVVLGYLVVWARLYCQAE